MSDYVTATQVAAFAQEFDALSPEGQDLIVTAASRIFDNLAGVSGDFFAPATGEYSDRVFFGNGTAYLRLDPYITLASEEPLTIVNSDDDEVDVPEFLEQNGYLVIRGYGAGVPINTFSSIARIEQTWPSDQVLTYGQATSFAGWPLNLEITVEADWGFESVPADVQQAAIQLAIHLWRTGDPAFTVISQSGNANTAPAIPAQAQEIADRYKARYSETAVFA